MLELAGLLHDLGKLRVPDELLEKPGKLTHDEYSNVQRHSFDTYNILKNIHGFEDIALWAGQHHERINGSGYPYHLTAAQLSLEARIVAVADVFQALAQNRPYRKALEPEVIAAMLNEEMLKGKLDAEIVAMVLKNLHICWQASLAYSSIAH
jgi:HD-GYP domain-containing protein (c-di-GMP phosphodiesterase class II)